MAGWSLRIVITLCVVMYISYCVDCLGILKSYEQKRLKNPIKKNNCVPPCKIFHEFCKNEGKCREKGSECAWYCECPKNCEGFFCENIITKSNEKTSVEVQVVYKQKKKVSAFDKSILAQALANIFLPEETVESGKTKEGPESIERVGDSIIVSENVTVNVTICPPDKAKGKIVNTTAPTVLNISSSNDFHQMSSTIQTPQVVSNQHLSTTEIPAEQAIKPIVQSKTEPKTKTTTLLSSKIEKVTDSASNKQIETGTTPTSSSSTSTQNVIGVSYSTDHSLSSKQTQTFNENDTTTSMPLTKTILEKANKNNNDMILTSTSESSVNPSSMATVKPVSKTTTYMESDTQTSAPTLQTSTEKSSIIQHTDHTTAINNQDSTKTATALFIKTQTSNTNDAKGISVSLDAVVTYSPTTSKALMSEISTNKSDSVLAEVTTKSLFTTNSATISTTTTTQSSTTTTTTTEQTSTTTKEPIAKSTKKTKNELSNQEVTTKMNVDSTSIELKSKESPGLTSTERTEKALLSTSQEVISQKPTTPVVSKTPTTYVSSSKVTPVPSPETVISSEHTSTETASGNVQYTTSSPNTSWSSDASTSEPTTIKSTSALTLSTQSTLSTLSTEKTVVSETVPTILKIETTQIPVAKTESITTTQLQSSTPTIKSSTLTSTAKTSKVTKEIPASTSLEIPTTSTESNIVSKTTVSVKTMVSDATVPENGVTENLIKNAETTTESQKTTKSHQAASDLQENIHSNSLKDSIINMDLKTIEKEIDASKIRLTNLLNLGSLNHMISKDAIDNNVADPLIKTTTAKLV